MQSSARFGFPSPVDVSTWSQVTHERNMRLAIRAARTAAYLGGACAGAVIVDPACRVVAEGYSLAHQLRDPTAHAETNAIRSASLKLGRNYLPDMVLYTTFAPCSMCLGACGWAGLGGVVFGADGTAVPHFYFDQIDYCAAVSAAKVIREGVSAPLFVRGRVLFDEAADLLHVNDFLEPFSSRKLYPSPIKIESIL